MIECDLLEIDIQGIGSGPSYLILNNKALLISGVKRIVISKLNLSLKNMRIISEGAIELR